MAFGTASPAPFFLLRNYLNELKKTRHKTYLISGILRENQVFLNGMAAFQKSTRCFTYFCTK
jgi:3-deoxy-D-manno-octulosonic-acid transferase